LESVTANGDGTVTVAEAQGFIRVGDDSTSALKPVTIPATTLTPSDGITSYVVAEYNSGSPRFVLATDITTVACRSSCGVAVLYRNGTDVKVLPIGNVANDFSALYLRKEASTNWLQYASGALIGSSGLNLTLTAGAFYNGINRYETPAFDTSDTDTFLVWYRDGSGGWTSTTAQSAITPSWYDDGTGTINTSAVGWRKNSVWLQIDDPTTLHVVLGQESFGTVAAAEESQIPSDLPQWAQGISVGKLVGVEIHKASLSEIEEVGSPFLQSFVFNAPTSHNGLSGLQGGTTDEYYHLTSAQHTALAGVDTANIAYKDEANTWSAVQTFSSGFTTSGNVGIGSASPGVRLVIEQPSATGLGATALYIYSPDSGGNEGAGLEFGSSSVTNAGKIYSNNDGTYGWLLFQTNRGSGLLDDMTIKNGNVWIYGDCSALSFTDRTPYPDSLQVAIDAVNSMQKLPDGEYDPDNKEHQLDHSKLHQYLKSDTDEDARDMSASISCINEVVKHLLAENSTLKAENAELKAQTDALIKEVRQLNQAVGLESEFIGDE
jgi:hypothetical protein